MCIIIIICSSSSSSDRCSSARSIDQEYRRWPGQGRAGQGRIGIDRDYVIMINGSMVRRSPWSVERRKGGVEKGGVVYGVYME